MRSGGFSADAEARICATKDVRPDEMILDVGPETELTYCPLLQEMRTIVWNGPVGVFEFPAFSGGTRALGEAVARSPAYSFAGGGDTVSAIEQFALNDNISYISTGGGALLSFMEGKALPAVTALNKRDNNV